MTMLKESKPAALELFIHHQAQLLSHFVLAPIHHFRPLHKPVISPTGPTTVHSLLLSMKFDPSTILHSAVPHGVQEDTIILASHQAMAPHLKNLHCDFMTLATNCFPWASRADFFMPSLSSDQDVRLVQLQLKACQQEEIKLQALFAGLEAFPPLSDDEQLFSTLPRAHGKTGLLDITTHRLPLIILLPIVGAPSAIKCNVSTSSPKNLGLTTSTLWTTAI